MVDSLIEKPVSLQVGNYSTFFVDFEDSEDCSQRKHGKFELERHVEEKLKFVDGKSGF
jgi:hypothetical protein